MKLPFTYYKPTHQPCIKKAAGTCFESQKAATFLVLFIHTPFSFLLVSLISPHPLYVNRVELLKITEFYLVGHLVGLFENVEALKYKRR